jgi:hypothetical protein
MDENRKFFRIKNNGEIMAFYEDRYLKIIDISPCSAAITTEVQIPDSGVIKLRVEELRTTVCYEVLKKTDEKIILIFKGDKQINQILQVLKKLKKTWRDY